MGGGKSGMSKGGGGAVSQMTTREITERLENGNFATAADAHAAEEEMERRGFQYVNGTWVAGDQLKSNIMRGEGMTSAQFLTAVSTSKAATQSALERAETGAMVRVDNVSLGSTNVGSVRVSKRADSRWTVQEIRREFGNTLVLTERTWSTKKVTDLLYKNRRDINSLNFGDY